MAWVLSALASDLWLTLPAIVSVNLRGQTKRAVGVSVQIGIGNFGGVGGCQPVHCNTNLFLQLVASNIYRNTNGGRYFTGHGTNMGLLGMGIVIAPLYAFLLRRENRKRDAWQAHQNTLPEEQRTKFTIQELHEAGDNAKGKSHQLVYPMRSLLT